MPLFKKLQRSSKIRKLLCRSTLVIFLVLNILSYVGAYIITHFSTPGHFGLGLPRPTSSELPSGLGLEYVTKRIPINQNQWLETWFIPVSHSQGTILLFPGNAATKAPQLLAPTKVFHTLGYDSLLVDFRGVGGSSGSTTTLGVREAKDVGIAMSYAQRSNLKRPFILYGISMGSAAILKAVAQEKINPDAIIIELPFARLIDAVRSRLRAIKVASFPMAELVVFWGSVQHRFNGFAHNPVVYATQVKCPTLLMHGKLDKWTSMKEINQIFDNLRGFKELVIFPNTGHSLLVSVDKPSWKRSVSRFLTKIGSSTLR